MINSFSVQKSNAFKNTDRYRYQVILVLRARCASATMDKAVRLEYTFNTAQIQPTETTTKDINHFLNTELSAKSIGVHIEGMKLINKFLVSIVCDRHYSTTMHTFQLQRRDEMSTEHHNLAPLTMT